MGAPSKRIQHPGWSPLRKTRFCARDANRAGPLLPSGRKVHGIAAGCRHVWFCPLARRAQTAGLSRFVLSVRGEATLANNKHQHGSRAEAPSPLLPLRPRLKSQPGRRRTVRCLREGFPNAGAGTSRRPQGGLLSNPRKGGVCTADDITTERVPSQNGVLVN